MRQIKKRILSLLTAILMLSAIVPIEALAASGNGHYFVPLGTVTETGNQNDGTAAFETDAAVYINPAYIDVIDKDDIPVPDDVENPESFGRSGISTFAEDEESVVYVDTVEDAGAVLRAGMVAREETITVYYYGDIYSSDYFKDLCINRIIPAALAETGNANEGDYLRYNYGGTGYKASIAADGEGKYRYYTIVFTPTYFTTAEQETAVTKTVDALLEETLTFEESASDYEKTYLVYDYICSHVTYDNEHLDDSTYTLKYSTYAALLNGTAVCQGYASLFYRLLRELDMSVRIATGYGGAASEDTANYYENHAWNIAQIDSKWYYADSTWDAEFSDEVAAGTYSYQYFLKGTLDFDSLEAPYSTTGIHYLIMDEDFTNAYGIEETRYIDAGGAECSHEYVAAVTEPTCTESGYTTYTCSLCGDSYISDKTEALGHAVVTDAAVTATCEKTGLTEGTHCAVCGETLKAQEIVPAIGHSWDGGVVTKEATADEEGIRTYTCTVCGATKTETIAVKILSAPLVTLGVSQNNGKIRLTGTAADYENRDDYYTITGQGFVYMTKTALGTKSLNVNTAGRTKVSIRSIGSAGTYSYSMTPKSSSTIYVFRAFLTYQNSTGKTVYVYSNPVYTCYSGINL